MAITALKDRLKESLLLSDLVSLPVKCNAGFALASNQAAEFKESKQHKVVRLPVLVEVIWSHVTLCLCELLLV